MLLDPTALAWSSWISLLVGVFGLVVSIVGLYLTFAEARRAKLAALAAQSDVSKMLALTRSRTRLSALSSAVSQVDTLSIRIEKSALKGNREAFTAFRRAVKEALAIVTLDQATPVTEVSVIDDALDAIARLIDANLDAKVKAGRMLDALHIISRFLFSSMNHEQRRKA